MSPEIFAIIWSIVVIGWFILIERLLGDRFRSMLVTWSRGRVARGLVTTSGVYLVVSALAVLIGAFVVRSVGSPGDDTAAIAVWMLGTLLLIPVSMFPLLPTGMVTDAVRSRRLPRRVATAISLPAFLLGTISAVTLMGSGFMLFAT